MFVPRLSEQHEVTVVSMPICEF